MISNEVPALDLFLRLLDVFPHVPAIVEVLNDFGRILYITLCDLLVRSKAADWSDALLQVTVDNRSHVTVTQLKWDHTNHT